MKKIFLLLSIFTMVLTSCDPLGDINAEIDAKGTAAIQGNVAFTLTDDDYTAVGAPYGSFDTEADAKAKIPELLTSKYPFWGEKSSALVTFKLYSKKNDEKSLIVYTIPPAEYAASGNNYGSFSSMAQIVTYLNWKYPTPAERVLVSLTYEQYDSGVTTTVENGFIYSDGNWEMSMGLSDADYAAMGEARAQFSSSDEALVKIPIFLKDKLKYESPEAGDIQGVMYKLYVTDTQDVDGDNDTTDKTVYSYVVFFIYDGSNWVKYDNTIDDTIQFGHDGTTWVPDNTIKYTLDRGNGGDYDYLATALTEAEFADKVTSLGNYDDFDYTWSHDQIVYAMAVLAEHLNPNAEEGQKYLFTYVLYDNGENEVTQGMIKTGGAWVEN